MVDSRAWIEYLTSGPNAGFFAPAIEKIRDLLVPSLTICEVFNRVVQQRDLGAALQAIALLQQGSVIDLDAVLALDAARLTVEHHLPMADSVILATARRHGAILWTQDADFKGMPNVEYRKQRTRGSGG